MKISTLFIIDAVELDDNQRGAFYSLFAEWIVVNQKNGRMLISALINDDTYPMAAAALNQYNLQIVGKWGVAGEQLTNVAHVSEYVELLPSKFEFVASEFVLVDRTVAEDVAGWSGWAARSFE